MQQTETTVQWAEGHSEHAADASVVHSHSYRSASGTPQQVEQSLQDGNSMLIGWQAN